MKDRYSMKWYEQKFVNRRDWIIDQYETFNFSSNEGIVVLAIDFLNSHRIAITYDVLSNKTNLKPEEIDQVVALLVAKNYLEIRATAKGLVFNLAGLFESDGNKPKKVAHESVYDVYEQSFGRPLTNIEMEKINDWLKLVDSKLMIYALKEAVLYEKINMAYIEAILRDWQKKGITSDSRDKS